MDVNPKFEPVKLNFNYSTRIVCESIIDDLNGFRILLSGDGEQNKIEIGFEYPLVYRIIDEGDFLRTLSMLPKNRPSFIIEAFNTELINWYREETFNIATDLRLKHYILLSQNECIEVVSKFPPSIKLI